MSTIRTIRHRLEQGEDLGFEDVHVTAREFSVEGWIKWAEEIGCGVTIYGRGYGMRMPAGDLSKQYRRDERAFFAAINGDDPRGEKAKKIMAYFRRRYVSVFRGWDMSLQAFRLLAKHADHLPVVRTSYICPDRRSDDDRSKAIALYAITEAEIVAGPQGSEWEAAKKAELAERRAWYNAAISQTTDTRLQRRLEKAADAWRVAAELTRQANLETQAGYAKFEAWKRLHCAKPTSVMSARRRLVARNERSVGSPLTKAA